MPTAAEMLSSTAGELINMGWGGQRVAVSMTKSRLSFWVHMCTDNEIS